MFYSFNKRLWEGETWSEIQMMHTADYEKKNNLRNVKGTTLHGKVLDKMSLYKTSSELLTILHEILEKAT